MTVIPQPGTSELGWLADLKQTAEQVGSKVYGEPVRWDVEVIGNTTARRPDVLIRRDSTREILAIGEAKRPHTARGIHPLVATEVRDAIGKAQLFGAPVCFTTNFFEIAVFDAQSNVYATDISRLIGGLITMIPPTVAVAPDWWSTLSLADRAQHTLLGLSQLFERIKSASSVSPTRDIDEVTMFVFSRTTERLVGPLYDILLNQRAKKTIPAKLIGHTLRVRLNVFEDAEARYLVAQGVAEILTAVLFYRNISDHFSLSTLLGGTDPSTGAVLFDRLNKSLQTAIARSGDYQTIFTLSPAGEWVLQNGGTDALQHWKNLFGFVEQVDYSTISSDVIGSIFERLISPERRHEMGQHYTQARVATSMSRWAVQSETDHIADIACGAGTFLVEVYNVLKRYGIAHSDILSQVLGNDLDPFAVHLATVNLATRDVYKGQNFPAVKLGDAFDIRPGTPVIRVTPDDDPPVEVSWPSDGLDSIVGNPPYSRNPTNVDSVRTNLARLGLGIPVGMTKGNLAAWFALLTSALLKKDGRFALVMPTGVLQNENLTSWRSWLRSRYDIVVWHTEEDVWFSDARVAVCVILASQPTSRPSTSNRLHFVNVCELVAGDLVELSGIPSPVMKAQVRDLCSLESHEDILIAGIYPDLMLGFKQSKKVAILEELAPEVQVFSGNKLGHEAYKLSDLAPTKKGLLRDVEGLKMRFQLSSKYLMPLLASPKDERTGEFHSAENCVLTAPAKLPPAGSLKDYIDRCKALGVHTKATIRTRGQSWWHVDWKKSQVAVQIHPGFLHQVWWSSEPFIANNNFHILEFGDSVAHVDRELLAASLASGFGALAALYISGEVGCEGVRWLSTEQFAKWPVLNPALLSKDERDDVLRAYRRFRKLEAREIHSMDQTAIEEWKDLTSMVAKAAGMPQSEKVAADVIEFARQTCIRRARRENLALSGRNRGGKGKGGAMTKQIHVWLQSSPKVPPVLEALTSGDHIFCLRSSEQLAQGSFEFAESRSINGEQHLSLILGKGFECAPETEEGEKLARDIGVLLEELTQSLLSPKPTRMSEDTEPDAYYSEIQQEIQRVAVKWLQAEVRKRLN